MPELITHTARLVPYAKRPKQVPSYVTAYSYEPMPDDPGANLGNLFVVVEVLVSGRTSEEIADLIIETLGDRYYNEANESADALGRFEAAVKAANHELAEYVNQGNAAWIGKLSAVVAVQVGEQLHLAQTGSAEAFLYRGRAHARIASSGNNARPAAASKTFGSIASGQLEAGDRVLMATPALIHQLSLQKLHHIIAETSPNGAISEIMQLLRGSSVDRIAALVLEITTPELAALQVRSEKPAEIQLGTPENAFEAAKLATAPLAQATVNSSRRMGGAARTAWQQARPHGQRLLQRLAGLARQFLAGPGARRRLIIAGTIAAALILGLWWWHTSQARAAQLVGRYQADYQRYQLAIAADAEGNKSDARKQLTSLQAELASLSRAAAGTGLDQQLKHMALAESEPTSLAAFVTLVNNKADQIDGLERLTPTTVVSFAQVQGLKPTELEIAGDNAYLFDSSSQSHLYVVNLSTKKLRLSSADTSKLGAVVSTTLSAAGDGIFILTHQPSVWFYQFSNDSLTQQTIGLDTWPTAKAIASYATNLYLLGDDAIYKHVHTYTGYSPKTSYLSAADNNALANTSALAVDGSVYALSPSGLQQYLSGTLKQTTEVPSTLIGASRLRSISGGATIMAVSPKTQRIGLWSNTSSLLFSKQYQLNNATALYDATYDDQTNTGYALVNGRLVQFTP
ncbi:MAG TPA: hypothetical protein VLI05_00125 [Candidatus Saccharimonadia bacterium]|nr:hypothetical protein [Candidatus Saccharimonadia bacterium]